MKVQVEALDGARRKIEVLLDEETLAGLREFIFEEVRKGAKLKGFRPGKAPKSIIMQYYKDYIDDEAKKKMVENTMLAALQEAKVNPIIEPSVEFIEKDGQQGYILECEVLPEIELPQYKGVEVEVAPTVVADADIEKRVEGLLDMHAEVVAKPADSAAELGNFVVVKYQGYLNGEPLKEVAAETYPVELGNSMLMADFENGILGMKENEEKEVNINFPEDYPDKTIAGKEVLFKITMKEVKQKRLPELNDDFSKDLGYENVDALRQAVNGELIKEKQEFMNREATQKILEAIMKDLDIPIPKRLLEKRIEGMVEDTKSRYQADRFSAEEMASLEQRMRADFGKRAEDRLKAEIVLARIAEKEQIVADDLEVEDRLKKIAEEANKSYNDIWTLYNRYNLMGGLKSTIIEEKTVTFLKDNAVIKEKA